VASTLPAQERLQLALPAVAHRPKKNRACEVTAHRESESVTSMATLLIWRLGFMMHSVNKGPNQF
jgi:hypothetical protein